MTAIPPTGYFSDPVRDIPEAKQGLDDVLEVLRELPGGTDETALTIAAGVVTPTGGIHAIDTEGADPADDLTNIATTNHPDGRLLLIHSVSGARVPTVKHAAGGAGQIFLAEGVDLALGFTTAWLLLKRSGAAWEEVMRAPLPGADGPWTDAASAATVNLGAIRSANVRITGNTGPVTSFGTAPGGVRKKVRCASNPTIAYNAATMLIQGGMGVTMGAGWTFDAHSLGGGAWLIGNIAPPDGQFLFGDLTPAQITATQNDYAPTGHAAAAVLRLSADAARTITGLAGGADRRVVTLVNVGAFAITLADEDAASAAANRFALPDGNLELRPDASAWFRYDGTASRWRPAASSFNFSGLSEDTTPDLANDFLLSFDISTGLPRKVKPSNVAASGATQIGSSAASGTSVSFTSIPATYQALAILCEGLSSNGASTVAIIEVSTNNGSSWVTAGYGGSDPSGSMYESYIGIPLSNASDVQDGHAIIHAYALATGHKPWQAHVSKQSGTAANLAATLGQIRGIGAINAIRIRASTGSFDAGTFRLLGLS